MELAAAAHTRKRYDTFFFLPHLDIDLLLDTTSPGSVSDTQVYAEGFLSTRHERNERAKNE